MEENSRDSLSLSESETGLLSHKEEGFGADVGGLRGRSLRGDREEVEAEDFRFERVDEVVEMGSFDVPLTAGDAGSGDAPTREVKGDTSVSVF